MYIHNNNNISSSLSWSVDVSRTKLRRTWATIALRSLPSAADTDTSVVWNLPAEFRDQTLSFGYFKRTLNDIIRAISVHSVQM